MLGFPHPSLARAPTFDMLQPGCSSSHAQVVLHGLELTGRIRQRGWGAEQAVPWGRLTPLTPLLLPCSKFVRSAWGWTCIFLGGFILLVVYLTTQRLLLTLRHLSRLVVGAGLWLGATETFLLIENLTGYCFDPVPEGFLVNNLTDKWTCLHKGHQWHGYDVSGHTFLLTFCCLLMVEETSVFRRYLAQGHPAGVPLRLIFLLNVLLLGLWNFLLACTVVYLYEYSHKVVGAAIATLCWYLTYRVWYRYSWSPGRPGAGLFLKPVPGEAKKRN